MLKKLRINAGFTQAELAEKLEVNPHTVIRWEAGETSPNMKHFPKLREIFGKDADKLLESEAG